MPFLVRLHWDLHWPSAFGSAMLKSQTTILTSIDGTAFSAAAECSALSCAVGFSSA